MADCWEKCSVGDEGLFFGLSVYLGNELNDVEREELVKYIDDEGGSATDYYVEGQTTHAVVPATPSGSGYIDMDNAIVILPSWIRDSYLRQELQDAARYSTDPELVFSGLTVCSAQIYGQDRSTLIFNVDQGGGQFEKNLSAHCTHLLLSRPDGAKYAFAMKNSIPCLHSSWARDSLVARRRLPEADYDVTNNVPIPPPTLPRAGDEEEEEEEDPSPSPTALLEGKSMAEAVSRRVDARRSAGVSGEDTTLKLPTPADSGPTRTASSTQGSEPPLVSDPNRREVNQYTDGDEEYFPAVLKDLSFSISPLINNPERRKRIIDEIVSLGGSAWPTMTYVRECTHFLCEYQTGEDYDLAVLDGKAIVSEFWLHDCITTCAVPDCEGNVLYHPLRDIAGIVEMHEMYICLTNFTNEERGDVKSLITACGAHYSGTLRKTATTHLISRGSKSTKFEKAMEWGIPVVTRAWLEDCIRHWKLMDTTEYWADGEEESGGQPATNETYGERSGGAESRSSKGPTPSPHTPVDNGIGEREGESGGPWVDEANVDRAAGCADRSDNSSRPGFDNDDDTPAVVGGNCDDGDDDIAMAEDDDTRVLAVHVDVDDDGGDRSYDNGVIPDDASAGDEDDAGAGDNDAGDGGDEVDGDNSTPIGDNDAATIPVSPTRVKPAKRTRAASTHASRKRIKQEPPRAGETSAKNAPIVSAATATTKTETARRKSVKSARDTVPTRPARSRVHHASPKKINVNGNAASDGGNAYRFMLSRGLSDCQPIVTKLGGSYTTDGYDDQVTHLVISGELKRTEKMLCACAAGLWVVNVRYLMESLSLGHFVSEELFECTQNSEVIGCSKVWPGAMKKWRELRQSNGKKAFSSFTKPVLLYPVRSDTKSTLERVLTAGGAEVVKVKTLRQVKALCGDSSDESSHFSLAVVVSKVKNDPSIMLMVKKGIPVVAPEYIFDFLTNERPVHVNKYMVAQN